jgi:hypothetical protein
MRSIAAFLALSSGDKALLLRAFAVLTMVRVALAILPLERLRAWARQLRSSDGGTVDRVVWAVSTASRRVPGVTCLVSAFALQRLLAREGHASELHIGVAKRGEVLAAHAWVACEGRTLIGEYDDEDYTHLIAWRAAEPSGEA